MSTQAPYIPENAPFTPAQRAWLNGWLAGLFASQPVGGAPALGGGPAAPAVAPAKLKLAILFGSESGNSEALAKRLTKAATKRGFLARTAGLDKISAKNLLQEEHVLIITSTFGDGEPPENAKAFHEELHADYQPRLEGLGYAILALGDRHYEKFCQCGIEFDRRLSALGAQRLYERVDCDVDYESAAEQWMTGVFTVLETQQNAAPPRDPAAPATPTLTSGVHRPEGAAPAGTAGAPAQSGESPRETEHPGPGVATALAEAAPAFSKKNLFPAPVLANRKLTTEASAKETRHYEFSLAGSGLKYEAGDALGVLPQNCPAVVDDLLRALNRDGEEAVPTPEGGECSLRQALLRHYDVTKIPATLLKWVAEHTPDATLRDLLVPEAKEALKHYLYGREIIDLLVDFPAVAFTPPEFIAHLRKLQPRLYSISSSLKAFPEQVHLTIAAVRYQSFGRARKGVCSTFLADRANGAVPVFVQTSHGFRLPAEGGTPIIMVGPGTGIAPFRAFLHDRQASGAPGRNWLFFGDQRASSDFLYREELETMRQSGHLTRLSTAFSRDQAEKVYVQNRMAEEGAELWRWLEEGAHFYVCGDASRMAKDVDAALHTVIAQHGARSPEAAAEYVQRLKSNRRYQRDVY